MKSSKRICILSLLLCACPLKIQADDPPAGIQEGPAQYMNKTADQWIESLKDSEHGIEAMAALIQGDQQAIQVLMELLKNPEPSIQTIGAMGLSKMGASARPALTLLIQGLQSNYLNLKYYAAEALGNLGGDGAPAVPALTEALKVTEETGPDLVGPSRYFKDLRWMAAQSLAKIGPAAKTALPQLQKLADDPKEDKGIRDAASQAIRTLSSTKVDQKP